MKLEFAKAYRSSCRRLSDLRERRNGLENSAVLNPRGGFGLENRDGLAGKLGHGRSRETVWAHVVNGLGLNPHAGDGCGLNHSADLGDSLKTTQYGNRRDMSRALTAVSRSVLVSTEVTADVTTEVFVISTVLVLSITLVATQTLVKVVGCTTVLVTIAVAVSVSWKRVSVSVAILQMSLLGKLTFTVAVAVSVWVKTLVCVLTSVAVKVCSTVLVLSTISVEIHTLKAASQNNNIT